MAPSTLKHELGGGVTKPSFLHVITMMSKGTTKNVTAAHMSPTFKWMDGFFGHADKSDFGGIMAFSSVDLAIG